jgi:hypothetical protein
MSHPRLALALLLAAVAYLPACALDEADAFRGGVPTHRNVDLQVPGGGETGAQGALTVGSVQGPLLGERAEFYTTTRVVTQAINGGTYFVLTLVRTIVGYPATAVTGQTAVWGPHSDPLDPNAWKLTVTRVEGSTYDYRLEAKAKRDPDTAFLTILAGRHTAVPDGAGQHLHGVGSGTFLLDWEAARMLPEHDPKNFGRATFTYSRLTLGDSTRIDVDFKGIKDQKTGEIHDALYKYASTPGAGGFFEFASRQDSIPGPLPTGTAKEKATLKSRWLESGAGRGDFQVSEGDLAGTATPAATASECWDQDFASQYKNLSYDPAPASNWGQESSCSFPSAEHSLLAI